MKVSTSRFGELEVAEADVFELSAPIPGFPKTKKFFFLQKDNIKPFKWMQSIEEADLTFVVVEPNYFFHDYIPDISIYDAKEIGADKAEDLDVILIVVLPEDMSKMTANLKGPVIMCRETRKMKQVFIESDRWGVRESILEGIKRKEKAALESGEEKSKEELK